MIQNEPSSAALPWRKNLLKRLWAEWALIALLSSALLVYLTLQNATARADNLLYDWMAQAAPANPAANTIVIAIDEASLAEYGRWPWPRSTQAKLAEKLASAQTKAVVWDIILSEAGADGEDAALAKAFDEIDTLFLAQHIVAPGLNGAEWQFAPPAAVFQNPARQNVHVAIGADTDGAVRTFAPCLNDGAGAVRHAAIALHQLAQAGGKKTYLKDEICADRWRFRMHKPGELRTASFSDVAEGRLPSAFLKDAVVIVGASAAGLGDQHLVSGSGGQPVSGAELIAGIYSALEQGSIVKPLPHIASLLLSACLLITFLLLVWRLKPNGLLWLGFLLMLAALGISLLLLHYNIWWPPTPALAALLAAYPLWGWRRLAAITAHLDHELALYANLPQFAPAEPAPLPADKVAQQGNALHHMLLRHDNLQRYLSDVLHGLPDPMFVTDNNRKILETSAQAQACLGLIPTKQSREEALIYLAHPDDLLAVRDFCEKPVDPSATIRFRGMAGGSAYLMRRTALYDAEGAIRAEIHYLTDIGPLEEARRARDEALSLISHDLRSPQAAILASLQKPLDEETAIFIARQAQKTIGLAERFVDLTRMRETAFVGEELLFSELIAETLDDMYPISQAANVRVEFDKLTEDSFIIGEADSLNRALQNLIDNALKYGAGQAPEGQIAIRLQKENRQNRAGFQIDIEDNGPGMSSLLIPRLFERFTRNDQMKQDKGFGLGLYYVASVIQRHNGLIKCENKAEGGALFTIWLPAALQEEYL